MTELLREDHGDFVSLQFSGEERLNAFSIDTYTAFSAELERFARENRWKAMIFTGAGRAFCSGQDLGEAGEAQSMSVEELRARLELLQQITRLMRSIPKLLIAAINGPAVGFGAELTLACDVRFASADAYLMFPELARGLYFTNATLELLPAFTSSAHACDLLFSGKRWSADEALAAGFVSRVLKGSELLPEAYRFAEQAGRAPAGSLAATLRFMRARHSTAIETALRFEVDTFLAMSAEANSSSPAGSPITGDSA
jgi:2-(1,2-epoxy-1,2-dihydrophenyl)acetyl-CoA isomerase